MNTTYTVSSVTCRIIRGELDAAASDPDSALDLTGLQHQSNPTQTVGDTHANFLKRYPLYLRVNVHASAKSTKRNQWLALVKARLRHIPAELLRSGLYKDIHPYPIAYSPVTIQQHEGSQGDESFGSSAAIQTNVKACQPADINDESITAPVLCCFFTGLRLDDGTAPGLGNYVGLTMAAVEELATQCIARAQRGGWYTPDMAVVGQISEVTELGPLRPSDH